MSDTISKLKAALASLKPTHLEIQDDSALHAGHPGNTGGGHYTVIIESTEFKSLTLIKCHRLVYQSIGSLMDTEIHALSIKVSMPK